MKVRFSIIDKILKGDRKMFTARFLKICKMSQPKLKKFCVEYLKYKGYDPVSQDGFVYAKGTVPVLLVAHMDTVHKELPKKIFVKDGKVSSLQGIGGDDRCGIYMIMKIVDSLKCSVLFTEDEEIGGVGAIKFTKTEFIKKLDVNYMVELDRRGKDDAVFYDCDNPDFTKFVTDSKIGFKEAHGSFTDISYLCEASGIAGVNFSCGYYSAHTVAEYVNVPEMMNNIERVKKIIEKRCEKPFKYIERKRIYGGYRGGYSYYGNYWQDDMYEGGSYGGSYWSPSRSYYGGSNLKKWDQSESFKKEVTMSFVFYVYDENQQIEDTKTATVSASSEDACWRKFFEENAATCYADLLDWDIVDL